MSEANNQQQQQTPWYAADQAIMADADLKSYVEGKKFPTLADALKSGMHADNVARTRNVFERPAEGKIKEWGGWKELGWIEDPAKYEQGFKRPEAKEGRAYSERAERAALKAAHEARAPLPVVQAIIDAVAADMYAEQDELANAGAQNEAALLTALRGEWGGEFDTKRTLALRAAETFAKKAGVDALAISKLEDAFGGAPQVLKMFAEMGAMMGEDKMLGLGGGGNSFGAKSKATLQAELNALHADPAFMKAMNDAAHPMHATNKEKRQKLIEQMALAK